MELDDIRNIGARLKREIPLHLDELRKGAPLGRGAGGDVTHPIDKEAEDIIIEELERLGKPVTVISEECGLKHINGGGPRLLIDPIDGSRNALSGVTLFSTSIALVDGDTIEGTFIGYVLNVISGDEFWALKDHGSFLNGTRIATQAEDACRVIAYEAQNPGRDIARVMPLISLFNRARCFGSTALDMAFLAQGAVSMMVIPSPSRSFDFAAGHLLVKEAGGVVSDLEGRDLDSVDIGVKHATPVLASANQALHEKALEVLCINIYCMPKKKKQNKKYPCPDCNFCQWCSDTRCWRCRPPGIDMEKK
jgi:myo-inositol-1(or 4)-monophosphatase